MSYREFLALCRHQHGIVTSAQAHRTGVSNVELHRMVLKGDLARLRRGVYRHEAVPLQLNEELKAAWQSLYPEMTAEERLQNLQFGVVRGESAAEVLQMGDLYPSRHSFFVPPGKKANAADIELKRSPLSPEDVTVVDGLPVTTPTRTVIDLLEELHEPDHIAEAIRDAADRGLSVDTDAVRRALPRYCRRTGLAPDEADIAVLSPALSP